MTAKRVTHGISVDPETLEEAKERAEELKISFSSYVYHLIRADLKKREPLVIDAPERSKKKTKS